MSSLSTYELCNDGRHGNRDLFILVSQNLTEPFAWSMAVSVCRGMIPAAVYGRPSPLLCPSVRLEYKDMSMGSVMLLNPKAPMIHKLLPRAPTWQVSFPPTGWLSRIIWLWLGLFPFKKQTCTFTELKLFNHPSVNTESQTITRRARKTCLWEGKLLF